MVKARLLLEPANSIKIRKSARLSKAAGGVRGKIDLDMLRFVSAFRKIRRGNAVRKIEAMTTMGDMTLEELEILLILASLGQPCRMGELGVAAETNPANTARTVKLLEAKGLVIRTRSEVDGRGALVGLTEIGRLAAAQMSRRRARLLSQVLRELPGGNAQKIVEALENLSIALETVAELQNLPARLAKE